ncbi:MAG: sugar transferase [Acidobacteria bacterium]|nr:sugar transferase [Acidobacteriota bacterium]
MGALLVAYHLRFGIRHITGGYLLLAGLGPPVWLAVFAALRLYEAHRMAPEEEFRRVLSAVSIGVGLVVMTSYWTKAELSRAVVALTWTLAVAFEMAIRCAWRRRRDSLADRGLFGLRTLVVGTNGEAARLGDLLREPGLGFVPVGYVATALPAGPGGPSAVGGLAGLRGEIRRLGAECMFVTGSAVDPAEVCEVARVARQEGVELLIASRLPEVLATRLTVRRVGSVAAVSVMPPRLSRAQAVLKRAFDLVLACGLLGMTAPLWGAIAVAVRLTSVGPVLYRQPRVTRGGRVFTMLKFRTMVVDADRVAANGVVDDSVPFFKLGRDPRVTRVGRVLRRLSLDEIPQLVNVVRGEMSLVGPRPLPVEQVRAHPDVLGPRLEVPAGMTGWWQIRGRSDLPPEKAVRLDLFYVENWSLAYDLYILVRTIGAVLRGRGAT